MFSRPSTTAFMYSAVIKASLSPFPPLVLKSRSAICLYQRGIGVQVGARQWNKCFTLLFFALLWMGSCRHVLFFSETACASAALSQCDSEIGITSPWCSPADNAIVTMLSFFFLLLTTAPSFYERGLLTEVHLLYVEWPHTHDHRHHLNTSHTSFANALYFLY